MLHVPMRLRALIADDHPQMLAALERLIEPWCEIVGTVTSRPLPSWPRAKNCPPHSRACAGRSLA
jgi:hypothetical protein